MPKVLLHLEGLVFFITAVYFYSLNGGSWWLFIFLILTPDIGMLGYLFNRKIGAVVYNLFHTFSVSVLFLLIGFLVDSQTLLSLGLIWIAHISIDRFIGYGLKYDASFKDTHIQRV
ncbi:hypothetical protein JOC86_003547 [Bacillus pakistanensis]|uniref:DUF4260 domain-containing protein n=1 Tax=Rossellomorea pakistanensis TaxID=992288 RepID=A0ABS2NGK0_9BACI|nr:DUF4260 domain-containing protein [Bacillus pakistanensis]MBM7586995.1 hypothetical protein [Bacillus pakistanensis]